jgi:hypothetical protein
VYVVREDLKNPNLLFVGTEFGVFYSIDGGKSWASLRRNLPTVAVHDLVIHPRDNDLIAGTHGRGIWIMDDITPLQQATMEVLASDAHLFENRRATKWLTAIHRGRGATTGTGGSLFFEGENPSRDAFIHYYLNPSTAGQVLLEVSNITGELKRTYSFAAKPGINRLAWDMRYDPTPEQCDAFNAQLTKNLESNLQTATADQRVLLLQLKDQLQTAGKDPVRLNEIAEKLRSLSGRGGFGRQTGLRGNPVETGDYRIKMTVNGKILTGEIVVREDPLRKEGN